MDLLSKPEAAADKIQLLRDKVCRLRAVLTPDQMSVFQKHFELFDLDGDGLISARELRKVSRQMGYRLDDAQIEKIMKDNDVDDNGFLSFDEFLLSMHNTLAAASVEEHRRAEVRRKFVEFDRDGSGLISVDEAHRVLERELHFTKRQSAGLFSVYDLNGDGQLDFEEFIHFYAKVKHKIDTLRQLFREFDTDNSGAVSLSEATPRLRQLGLSEAEIERLIKTHDKNKDGELQYDEFVSLMLHS